MSDCRHMGRGLIWGRGRMAGRGEGRRQKRQTLGLPPESGRSGDCAIDSYVACAACGRLCNDCSGLSVVRQQGQQLRPQLLRPQLLRPQMKSAALLQTTGSRTRRCPLPTSYGT